MPASLLSACLALLVLLTPGPAPLAAEGAEGPRIAPGDRLAVEVWREPDLSGELVVDERGRIQHVLLGPVDAAGKTPEELASALRAGLERDYLREARVVVRVVDSLRYRAAVLGAVARPGRHPVRPGMRVLDLLLAAGGTTAEASGGATLLRFPEPEPGPAAAADAADPAETRGREPTERVEIDVERLLRDGDGADNPSVSAGDVLVVDRRESRDGTPAPDEARVRIVGEVERPGSYAVREAPTALDAVLAAGGFTEWASGNRARLVRGAGEAREERRVRLRDLTRGRAGVENPELEDGDLIVVPEALF